MAESELEESVPWLVEQQQQLKNQQPVPQNGGLADMAAVLLFCVPPLATTTPLPLMTAGILVFPSLSHFCR